MTDTLKLIDARDERGNQVNYLRELVRRGFKKWKKRGEKKGGHSEEVMALLLDSLPTEKKGKKARTRAQPPSRRLHHR